VFNASVLKAQTPFYYAYDTLNIQQVIADGIYTFQNNVYLVSYYSDNNGFSYSTVVKTDTSGNELAVFTFDTARIVNMFEKNGFLYYTVERDFQPNTRVSLIKSNADLDTLSIFTHSITNVFIDVHHSFALNNDTIIYFAYENDFASVSQQKFIMLDAALNVLHTDSVNAPAPQSNFPFYHFVNNSKLYLGNYLYSSINVENIFYSIDLSTLNISMDTLNLKNTITNYNQFICNNPGVFWDMTSYDGVIMIGDTAYFVGLSAYCNSLNNIYTLPSVIKAFNNTGINKFEVVADMAYEQNYLSLAQKRKIMYNNFNGKLSLYIQQGCYTPFCLGDTTFREIILAQSDIYGNLTGRYKISNDSLNLIAVDFTADATSNFYLQATCLYKNNNPNNNSGYIVYKLNKYGFPNSIDAKKEKEEGEIVLYPNPVKENLTVQGDFNKEKVEVVITDALGRVLYYKLYNSVGNSFNISAENFPAGIYFMNIRNNQTFNRLKFIKQ
jgi:hypothetical protein